MSKKRSSRKAAISIIENIFMLAGLIVFVWWGASDLILMISLKLIQWYDYIFAIFLGILAIIVFVGIVKNLLAIVFAQRQRRPAKEERYLL